MKDAGTWARQVVSDVVAAARAKGDLALETELIERIERRLRDVQLDAVREAMGTCRVAVVGRPRFEVMGAERCVSAIADLSLKIHANRQVPANA